MVSWESPFPGRGRCLLVVHSPEREPITTCANFTAGAEAPSDPVWNSGIHFSRSFKNWFINKFINK